jgi:prophage regulatory protein
MAIETIRLVSYEELRGRGITYTKRSLWRLERVGKFPKRVNSGARVSWVGSEIDEYLRALIAARDGAAA